MRFIDATVGRISKLMNRTGRRNQTVVPSYWGAIVTEVRSVGELLDYVATRVSVDNRILWFRGHRSREWPVAPSIWRGYDADDERNFTNRFRSRATTRMQTAPQYDDSAYWLSVMQHYGLPTRLLDWTRSPLIAAYFALQNYIYSKRSQPQDACIWVLEPHILNVLEGFDNVTPALDAHTCVPMLTPAFTHRDKENNKVIAAMAAERDLRMFVQQGCFTVHSARRPLNDRSDRDKFLTEILIPAECIRGFAQALDVAGFRKGDLFPDLANLADELKGLYPPSVGAS
ncbi:MAG: FRG domain-containing protein [Thermoanaerobaculia bacterium]